MKFLHSINDIGNIAAAVVGIEGWTMIRWQKMDGGSLVSGYVPLLYVRGHNKGKPRRGAPTPGTNRQVVVSDADADAHAAKYEATGVCYQCKGTGQQWNGWSRESGVRYCTCERCKGTGKPPQVPA